MKLPTRAKSIPIDPSLAYRCAMGHVSPYGAFQKGKVCRGDNPAVAAAPMYFVEDGKTSEEEWQILMSRGIQPTT